MSRINTIGDLFEEEPHGWGLRGDPYLWEEMRAYFSLVPLPSQLSELEEQIEHAFLKLSGQPLSSDEFFRVERFAHGGMSSGGISPHFWRDYVLPLLRVRYSERAVARAK
jgi:hypothetical protein